jgi:hypothetical protein
MTKGEIGVLLINGRQAGGFLNWEIRAITAGLQPGGQRVPTKATAAGFWLFEPLPCDGRAEAVFYDRVRDKLVIVNRAEVIVSAPDSAFDTLVREEIEMVFV